ncbi:hypothetical protein KHA90_04865 [Flavobacterium psychroterrae]|uniref:Uncharacterized protein n=1 Tax=Flavobacterium psychroterrae TaxID=2133767 RepID=A0ABS5P8Z0_9FLAO|nr:hypothetical protein [Flavobacterium psychroterrae]MBS7230348.1 hypothetical protein [Flavobacterium psychroterrae]
MSESSKEIKYATLESAYKAGIIKKISAIHANKNSYLFITLIAPNENSNNFYLTKKSSTKISKGEVLTHEQIKKSKLILSNNKHGKTRLKFLLPNSSHYTDLNITFEIPNDHESEVLDFLRKEIQSNTNFEEEEEEEEEEDYKNYIKQRNASRLRRNANIKNNDTKIESNRIVSDRQYGTDVIIILFLVGILFVLIFGLAK